MKMNTTFKDNFKYYKSRVPPPDFRDVIDLNNNNFDKVKHVKNRCDETFVPERNLGLEPPTNWEIFEFPEIPGLVFIKNPFTATGQRFWISKCLKDYSRSPNKLNIDAHNLLSKNENWWDICTAQTERGRELISKLRWATLGYHHNWDTKEYSEDSKTEMPEELSEMTSVLAKMTNFHEFKAEAAIINYYRINSTLAGHTDHSEVDQEAPLFSISFGQSAIFLIGGLTQKEPAKAILLRSGDVIVMSGKSRLMYHGVPKILPADNSPWSLEHNSINDEDWKNEKDFISQARININVRQVLKRGQSRL